MAIEDTFGYRFVRTSLVMLNCIIVLRVLSLGLQHLQVFNPAFWIILVLFGTNFMVAIIGAVREHRVTVILTGSITLIIFLTLIFLAKENRGMNFFLLILLAIAVQSLVFSEMLKERQSLFAQRRNLNYIGTLSGSGRNMNSNNSTNVNGHLAVVVYQTAGSDRPSGALFMVEPEIGSELAKDPPPSYFASHCPPPKYEDAIKLNAGDLSLPTVSANTTAYNSPNLAAQTTSSLPSPSPVTTSRPTESPSDLSAKDINIEAQQK